MVIKVKGTCGIGRRVLAYGNQMLSAKPPPEWEQQPDRSGRVRAKFIAPSLHSCLTSQYVAGNAPSLPCRRSTARQFV